MKTVTSRDGTRIAYDIVGQGPALILVGGALSSRSFSGANELVELLAPHFTVINYDRRGRGDSGDTLPYVLRREVEDIEALIRVAGGEAFLYGKSAGGALALEAASRLPGKVKKVLAYEPPFLVDDSRPPVAHDYRERLEQAIAEERLGDAVELFMAEAVGVAVEFLAQMRYGTASDACGNGEGMASPEWAHLETLAHTLPYDHAVMQGTLDPGASLPAHWSATEAPVLIVTGAKSLPFFHTGAQAVVKLLPDAEHRILDAQDHAVAPAAIAPLIASFFLGERVQQGPPV